MHASAPDRRRCRVDRVELNETGAELLIDDSLSLEDVRATKAVAASEEGRDRPTGDDPMTVRAILDTKGHQVESVEPETTLSVATKHLAERKIGAVLVMT